MNANTKTEVAKASEFAAPQGGAVARIEPAHPLTKLKSQLVERQSEFHAGLPAHIPAERFIRVVLTACQLNPDLLKADRASLFTSSMKAANDGLLPDGRDGALVIYSTKVGNDWVKKVSWMPMIGGLRKKVRNSGEIATWDVQAVHARDEFDFELGDNPFIRHKPHIGAGDPGPAVAFYSVAVLKSGEKSRDVMSRGEVEYVRDTYSKKDSRGNFSPAWVKSFDEMGKKTVARRHSKVLPMSTDLDDLIRRDDDLYDMGGKSDKALAAPPKTLGDRLDMLAGAPVAQIEHDAETGEVIENEASQDGDEENSTEQQESTATRDQAFAADKGAEAAVSSPAASAPEAKDDKTANKAASKVASKVAPEVQAPAAQRVSAEDRRKTILADLTKQGDENAAAGPRVFEEWLDGLTGDEMALISAAQVKTWKAEAARADG